jgi:protein N-terminal amidase
MANYLGNNFKSLQHINPFLEHTTSGITLAWTRNTALQYNCVVVVGYPEKVDIAGKGYNSVITTDAEGNMIANYRKLFLDDWDKPWATEGPDGFFASEIPTLGTVAMGIGK